MKKAFVVFGVLLGLQLAAVTASAATIEFCGPRALFNPETGERIVGRQDTIRAACAMRREIYGISSSAFSVSKENNIELLVYAVEAPSFSSFKWIRVAFGDLASARKFLGQIRSGEVTRAIAVLDESRVSELFEKNDVVTVSAAKVTVISSK